MYAIVDGERIDNVIVTKVYENGLFDVHSKTALWGAVMVSKAYVQLYHEDDVPAVPVAEKTDDEVLNMLVNVASDRLSDEQALALNERFVDWTEAWRGTRGQIVWDEGQLYRSNHDVTNAGQNTKPSETPSMWTRIADPAEEWPEWIQPLGAHDAYAKGAKVSHMGKRWISEVDGNTWEPGVAGWKEEV